MLKGWSRTKRFYLNDPYYYIAFLFIWLLFQLSWLHFQLQMRLPKVLRMQVFLTFSVLLTPFPINIFPNIEALKFSNTGRNLPSCLFISCFLVSLTPLINTPEFSSDYMILIISSNCSFKMAKVIPFPALTAASSRHFSLNSAMYCRSWYHNS